MLTINRKKRAKRKTGARMSQTLIKKYSSSVIKDFVERANDLKKLKHNLTKGELKELFVSRVLRSFLTAQFDIGSGIVINRAIRLIL